MAPPSVQTLQRLAGKTDHQPGTLEKVLRLLDQLQEMARNPVLSDRLVLWPAWFRFANKDAT